MKKIWVITILTVLLLSGKVFAGDSVKSAPGWLSSAPKVEMMTDTQLRQKALSEITLTDTWLNEHGYSRELKEVVMKKGSVYEKDGLYYRRPNNRLITSRIADLEESIIMGMDIIKSRQK